MAREEDAFVVDAEDLQQPLNVGNQRFDTFEEYLLQLRTVPLHCVSQVPGGVDQLGVNIQYKIVDVNRELRKTRASCFQSGSEKASISLDTLLSSYLRTYL